MALRVSSVPRPTRSLPLDGRGRLGRYVVDDTVYSGHFVGDAARRTGEERSRKPRPVGGHAVLAGHGTQRDDALVGALVAFHAHRLHRQEHGERLPHATVAFGAPELFDEDGVGMAEDREIFL